MTRCSLSPFLSTGRPVPSLGLARRDALSGLWEFLYNVLEDGLLNSGNATFFLAGISMKRRNFVFVFVIVLASMPSWAGEIFTYVDDQGSTVISDTPPPRNPKIVIKHREPSDAFTDEDRQALEKERTTRRKAWEEERRKEKNVRGMGKMKGRCPTPGDDRTSSCRWLYRIRVSRLA
jgi:hypothetical protein